MGQTTSRRGKRAVVESALHPAASHYWRQSNGPRVCVIESTTFQGALGVFPIALASLCADHGSTAKILQTTGSAIYVKEHSITGWQCCGAIKCTAISPSDQLQLIITDKIREAGNGDVFIDSEDDMGDTPLLQRSPRPRKEAVNKPPDEINIEGRCRSQRRGQRTGIGRIIALAHR
jgi:hypothetical protein